MDCPCDIPYHQNGDYGIGYYSHWVRKPSFQYYRGKVKAIEDNRYLIEKFGSFVDLNLTMTAPENQKDYFLNPKALEQISLFEEEIKKNPNISDVTSFISYSKAMNFAMNGLYTLPEQRSMILLLSRFFKAFDDTSGQYLNTLADRDFSALILRIWAYDSEEKWFLFED